MNTTINSYYLLFSETGASSDTVNGATIVTNKIIGTNRVMLVKATGSKVTISNGYYYAKVSG